MLTSVEYKNNKTFNGKWGRVFTKKEIFETVWGGLFYGR